VYTMGNMVTFVKNVERKRVDQQKVFKTGK